MKDVLDWTMGGGWCENYDEGGDMDGEHRWRAYLISLEVRRLSLTTSPNILITTPRPANHHYAVKMNCRIDLNVFEQLLLGEYINLHNTPTAPGVGYDFARPAKSLNQASIHIDPTLLSDSFQTALNNRIFADPFFSPSQSALGNAMILPPNMYFGSSNTNDHGNLPVNPFSALGARNYNANSDSLSNCTITPSVTSPTVNPQQTLTGQFEYIPVVESDGVDNGLPVDAPPLYSPSPLSTPRSSVRSYDEPVQQDEPLEQENPTPGVISVGKSHPEHTKQSTGRTITTRSYSKRRSSGPYHDAVAARKSKRAKQDLQDGDIIRGFACPYTPIKGSAHHCSVLLGSIHEVPRHLHKHVIEEEDRLRKDPMMDASTLVFGGAPALRPTCESCGEEFSRVDAWERHVKRSEERGECSTPVGMHGKHPALRTSETHGAAEVLARISVIGEKRFIEEVIEVYSTWSDQYRFKKIKGGKEQQPEWFRTGEIPKRGTIRTAFSVFSEWDDAPRNLDATVASTSTTTRATAASTSRTTRSHRA
ncbi:hypothetical protein DACRYDRAFT_109953 [Dacryopinax primogenitus]|uniref:Uncharacterized protein n=1 Tax=Dacryopinax primogenitus (strain DJM 731) TaxID=1858805 RepID=M5FT90_DACPD|nr:uncharacterized protein DACRYDRAFT_109953 [Dacryopinax primogenitus]EJT99233.1 hypothetical protein DACRYDRAFT_109953 [Dacryopinax primogenitus]